MSSWFRATIDKICSLDSIVQLGTENKENNGCFSPSFQEAKYLQVLNQNELEFYKTRTVLAIPFFLYVPLFVQSQ